MIYAGYVKVAPRKPQTGRVEIKISPGMGKTKFSLGERKKSTGSGFTGSVYRGVFTIHPLNLSLHHQQECTDCQTNFYSKQYTVFPYSSFLEPYTAQSGRVVDLKTDRKIGRTLELLV